MLYDQPDQDYGGFLHSMMQYPSGGGGGVQPYQQAPMPPISFPQDSGMSPYGGQRQSMVNQFLTPQNLKSTYDIGSSLWDAGKSYMSPTPAVNPAPAQFSAPSYVSPSSMPPSSFGVFGASSTAAAPAAGSATAGGLTGGAASEAALFGGEATAAEGGAAGLSTAGVTAGTSTGLMAAAPYAAPYALAIGGELNSQGAITGNEWGDMALSLMTGGFTSALKGLGVFGGSGGGGLF